VSRRKGMKLPPELEAKARALVRAQDADMEMARLEREALKSSQRGGPSKVERAYFYYLLNRSDVDGILAQPDAVQLAHGVSYTADYRVTYSDGSVAYVETKGTRVKRSKTTGKKGKPRPHYHDDGARVKVRVAAKVLAEHGVKLLVAFQDPTTKEWIHEEVPA
jgi:hypothetical protein